MHVHIHFKKDGYKVEVEGVADDPRNRSGRIVRKL